jgi:hypothetical protein
MPASWPAGSTVTCRATKRCCGWCEHRRPKKKPCAPRAGSMISPWRCSIEAPQLEREESLFGLLPPPSKAFLSSRSSWPFCENILRSSAILMRLQFFSREISHALRANLKAPEDWRTPRSPLSQLSALPLDQLLVKLFGFGRNPAPTELLHRSLATSFSELFPQSVIAHELVDPDGKIT